MFNFFFTENYVISSPAKHLKHSRSLPNVSFKRYAQLEKIHPILIFVLLFRFFILSATDISFSMFNLDFLL